MNGISAYQENAVTTQSRGKLVVMLYDGAIKFCKQAIRAIETDDVPQRHKRISQAQAIIDELNMSLDIDAGGEISKNLRALYQFIARHLDQANVGNDAQKIREVIQLLDELNQGWREIA